MTTSTFSVSDSNRAASNIRAEQNSDGSLALHHVPEISGTPGFTSTNPGIVKRSSSRGQDFSVNTPTLPAIGRAFGATGPYANFVRVGVVSAQDTRSKIEVVNLNDGGVIIIRDDGSAADGTAPTNASVIPLDAATAVGSRGGSWMSQTFTGRIQVYATKASAVVTVMVD